MQDVSTAAAACPRLAAPQHLAAAARSTRMARFVFDGGYDTAGHAETSVLPCESQCDHLPLAAEATRRRIACMRSRTILDLPPRALVPPLRLGLQCPSRSEFRGAAPAATGAIVAVPAGIATM